MTDLTLLISAGQGPRECAWVVGRLAKSLMADAKACGLKAHISAADDRELPSGTGEMPSCLVLLSGADADAFAARYVGSIRWTGKSPFRPNHKRTNWFVGVSRVPTLDEVPDLRAQDIRFQTMKAGGPGGQHVNTTDSAVRATHVPSGLNIVAREERSQHANKKLAVAKLVAALADERANKAADGKAESWLQHHALERGNAVRTYDGPKFRLKK